jgi:uncharacterized protein YecE (DUF72 family)
MIAYIGCSGYYYREWKVKFYPAEIPSTKWLQYYAQHFNTIEINATFYRFPTLKSLGKWYKDTPEDFVFTVKAPRLFTHYRKMNNVGESMANFYDTVYTALQEKVKCILYQFPATVKYSEALLETLMTLSDQPVLHAIEFRHASWWQPDVYAALKAVGITFVNVSLPGMDDVFVAEDETNYLRFHGKPILYKSGYGKEGLKQWVKELKAHPPKQLIAYFNNTWFSEAVTDGLLLRKMLGKKLLAE